MTNCYCFYVQDTGKAEEKFNFFNDLLNSDLAVLQKQHFRSIQVLRSINKTEISRSPQNKFFKIRELRICKFW